MKFCTQWNELAYHGLSVTVTNFENTAAWEGKLKINWKKQCFLIFALKIYFLTWRLLSPPSRLDVFNASLKFKWSLQQKYIVVKTTEGSLDVFNASLKLKWSLQQKYIDVKTTEGSYQNKLFCAKWNGLA